MKTGMEYPLIGLVVLLALVMLWNTWSGQQVDLSVAALNATVAGETAPAPVLLAGEWVVKAVVSVVIGGAVTAFLTALVVWARKRWSETSAQQSARQWKGGPNANWGQQPKPMSEAEWLRYWTLMNAGQKFTPGMRPMLPRTEAEDEPTINF